MATSGDFLVATDNLTHGSLATTTYFLMAVMSR